MPSERRPRLTPPIADVRRAVRAVLEVRVEERPKDASRNPPSEPLALVALSGGPDSLALATAAAFEGPRAGWRVGAIVVDHGLQAGSAEQADAAASVARDLGLDPVLVRK